VLYSFVDCNLYIPANALLLAWVAGLTESLAHAFSPRKRRSRSRRRKPLPTEIEADEVPAW